jgi:hypothetical protein
VTGTATPIPDFPEERTLATVNSHIEAGKWAFILIPDKTATSSPATSDAVDPASAVDTASPSATSSAPATGAPTTTGALVAVKLNAIWKDDPGALADRVYSQPADDKVDLATATPFYLSWSYVILSGDPNAVPEVILLPSSEGKLYTVSSPLSDRDCPDYTAKTGTGIGVDLTKCAVSVSGDGATPTGFAIAVPDADKQYWFFDAPEIQDAP